MIKIISAIHSRCQNAPYLWIEAEGRGKQVASLLIIGAQVGWNAHTYALYLWLLS
jgi:hypothetical protein